MPNNYYKNRAFVADEGFQGSSGPFIYNPPKVRVGYDTDLLTSPASARLTARINSSLVEDVQTHIPISAAVDPLSGQTIYAVVETEKVGTPPSRGNIWIYPGLETDSRFRQGSMLHSSNTAKAGVSHGAGLTFDLTTDRPVALACGDQFWGGSYNCLLAWQDRGTPQGRVVYTYFRINGTNQVEWLGQSYWRGGSRTVAGVSARYAGGGFHMAWKEWLGAESVAITTTSSYTSWSSVTSYSAPGIVDPPTFFYSSHEPYPATDRATAVVWTQQ